MVCQRSQHVWTQAVMEAESKRQALQEQAEESLREIQSIKWQLGLDIRASLGADESVRAGRALGQGAMHLGHVPQTLSHNRSP
jgi:hypothetical protein